MDMELFRKRLEELVQEFGDMALEDISVEISGRETVRGFVPVDRAQYGLDCFDAVRYEQPLKLHFTVHVSSVRPWIHASGDDRRLHPGLRNRIGG
jgi:hypothetical protein